MPRSFKRLEIRVVKNAAHAFGNGVIHGIDRGIDGTATVTEDGLIEFLGAPNHNGDAFFYYIVRDEFGAAVDRALGVEVEE